MRTIAFNVKVETRDGGTDHWGFNDEAEALSFCREEVKWESTLHVLCHRLYNGAILFDQQGDFAS